MTTKQVIAVAIGILSVQFAFSQHGDHRGGQHEYRHDNGIHRGFSHRDCHRGVDVVVAPPAPRVVVRVEPRRVVYREPVYVQPVPVASSRYAIAPQDFYNIKRTANALQYEEDRLNFVFGRVENNYFTSEQIADLMYCFSMDQNRLSLARYAYGKVVDPERYSVTYNALQYQENVRQLDAYIYGNQRYSYR